MSQEAAEHSAFRPDIGVGKYTFSLDGRYPMYIAPSPSRAGRVLSPSVLRKIEIKTSDTLVLPPRSNDGIVANSGIYVEIDEDTSDGSILGFNVSVFTNWDPLIIERVGSLDPYSLRTKEELEIINAMAPRCELRTESVNIHLAEPSIISRAVGQPKNRSTYLYSEHLNQIPPTEGRWAERGRFAYKTEYEELPFSFMLGFRVPRGFLGIDEPVRLVSGVEFGMTYEDMADVAQRVERLLNEGADEIEFRRIVNPFLRLEPIS